MSKTATTNSTDKYLDEYNRNARMMLAWVQPPELRTLFEKSLDLQVDSAKLVTKTVSDLLDKMPLASK